MRVRKKYKANCLIGSFEQREKVEKLRVLITGGAGFIGSWAYKELKSRGFDVISTDICPEANQTCRLDVREYSEVERFLKTEKPDAVLHLAALTGSSGRGGYSESLKQPWEYLYVNYVGTLNVFEACRKANITKAIYLSSFSLYGITQGAITEETPSNPRNPYGYSKKCAEEVVKCYATEYGVKSIIFRAPLVCGEGQREMNALREFVKAVLNGHEIVIFGNGSHVREWVHPIDLASAFIKGIEYFSIMESPYEIFVLGSKPISMSDLLSQIIKFAGKNGVSITFKPEEKVWDQFTDWKKAKETLGWEPQISVSEIIRRVVGELSQMQQLKPSQGSIGNI